MTNRLIHAGVYAAGLGAYASPEINVLKVCTEEGILRSGESCFQQYEENEVIW